VQEVSLGPVTDLIWPDVFVTLDKVATIEHELLSERTPSPPENSSPKVEPKP